MLEEVDPLHVVEVPDAVGHAVLGDDDGDVLAVLLPQPVDHLADGEGGDLQPARARGVPVGVVRHRGVLVGVPADRGDVAGPGVRQVRRVHVHPEKVVGPGDLGALIRGEGRQTGFREALELAVEVNLKGCLSEAAICVNPLYVVIHYLLSHDRRISAILEYGMGKPAHAKLHVALTGFDVCGVQRVSRLVPTVVESNPHHP